MRIEHDLKRPLGRLLDFSVSVFSRIFTSLHQGFVHSLYSDKNGRNKCGSIPEGTDTDVGTIGYI